MKELVRLCDKVAIYVYYWSGGGVFANNNVWPGLAV